MTFLSRKVDYSMLIMSVLHRRGCGASAREIAESFALSRPFVANILKRLCATGLVQSHRGVRGGYVLGRPATDITLSQLMDALDDPFHLTECTSNHTVPCSLISICPVKSAIGKVHRRISDILGHTTLDALFEDGSNEDGTIQIGFVPNHLNHLNAHNAHLETGFASQTPTVNQKAMAIA
ncbi:MAG: Rrf2 family transcriptional regulator [Gemmataceae bacterium]|nr:Rrf2 family transcriptional regulator [Gemmataceae bacterium]